MRTVWRRDCLSQMTAMWSEGEEETVTPLTSGSDHPSPASCLAGMWSEDEGPVMVVPTPRRRRPSPQSESSSCSEELDVTMRPASALPSPGPASASPSTSPVAAMPPSGPALSDPMPTKPRPVRPMLCSRRRLPHGRPPDPLCSHRRRCHPHSRPPELNCFALLCCHPLGRPPELFLICSLCSGFCGSLVFGLDPSVLGPHRPPWSGCFLFSVSIGLSGASP
ncbi:lysine-rich arabinogalactan protein 19-like isoform X2 [Oreochromis niloticus]|uniref:lysine-rich arabinogalactan protein 19-like isoform X2 n=1 Tax=Oreochromis niloticus TaxID=8128 RepID=UPI000904CC1C|nr:lysine-rich arabinogalactan protein 19-like isoform X2 [Oreochromis niloticus]